MAGVITSLPPPVAPPPANTTGNPQVLGPLAYVPAIPTLPQTWTGLQTFQPGTLELFGTGGASQVVKQTSLNAPLTVGQLAFSDISGSIGPLQLPTPTVSTLGGIFSKAAVSHNFLTQIGTDGSISQAQPAFTDISGSIAPGQIPNPTSSTLGGVQSAAAVSHQWINSISTSGVPALSQPAFSDISGLVAATQLPNPSASTLGGIQSAAAVSHQWINSISTSGVPALSQPMFADISGSVAASQMPALTGDVTTSAGTVATTIAANAVTNAKLATMAAWTFKVNNTSGAATPTDMTIDGLTLKGSPAAGDELIIWDVAGAAIKKATVSSVAAGSTVASIAGNTGAFTLDSGITNTVNAIEIDGNYTGWGVSNCTLAASVASNILTVAVKDNAGNDPSATSPCFFNYRNVTAATGSTTLVKQTAALSITTNATGATLGSSNNTAFRFWVVVFNNGGTNVLALINCSTATQIFPLNEGAVASSTAISGSATSAGVFYTPNGTTVTSKAFRILGYVEYNSTGLVTAGTYATGPNFIQTFGPGIKKPGDEIQTIYFTTTSAATNATNTMASSNATLNITPTSAANLIFGQFSGAMRTAAANLSNGFAQLFRSSTALGIITSVGANTAAADQTVSGFALDLPNTTSSTTYVVKFRNSDNATTITFPITPGGIALTLKEVMG